MLNRLLDRLNNSPARRAAETQKRKDVADWIMSIAVVRDDAEEFSRRALTAAQAVGVGSIELLTDRLHNPPEIPANEKDNFKQLGSWLAACQQAIFEILYYFEEEAIPVLNHYAYSDYDWTQSNAIEILCRFGIENLQRERIASALIEALAGWRWNTIESSISHLAKLACYSTPLKRALDLLIEECTSDDKMDAFTLIEAIAYGAPEIAKRYQPLLFEVMQTLGRTRPKTLDDAPEDAFVSISGYASPVKDYYAIRAALALRHLSPQNEEASKQLKVWAEHHPDCEVRDQIQTKLQEAKTFN